MIDSNVKFVMIGGYAYNAYRNPRMTSDIDFLVSKSPGNQQKIRDVLTNFGFASTLPPTGREKDAADARELEAWISSKQDE